MCPTHKTSSERVRQQKCHNKPSVARPGCVAAQKQNRVNIMSLVGEPCISNNPSEILLGIFHPVSHCLVGHECIVPDYHLTIDMLECT